MRKVGILAVFLAIFLLGFSFFPVNAYALTADSSVSVSSQPEVNYELPYPGLLPDSPLYFFRVVRDKIVSFLISAPLKKAEFNLLQADKRLNAGIYLVNKNKTELALSTISKAENYFNQALRSAQEARTEGINVAEIASKLMNASRKHQQALISLEEKALRNFKAGFNSQQRRVIEFRKEINSLTSER